jgi:hypothetical protein
VLRLLRQRNFGPYCVGNALSASGAWFQNLSAAVLIFRLTHSTVLLGVLSSRSSGRSCCSRRGLGARPTVSNTSATSRLQLEVTESQRGRIMALWGIAFLGVRPLASLVDGAIAQAWGVRTAGVVLALPALVLSLAIAARSRAQRTVSVPVSRGSLPKR